MELLGSIIIAIAHSVLFFDKVIGISMILFMILAIGIVWAILHKKEKIVNPKAMLLTVPILLLSSTYFIYANIAFYGLNVLAIMALTVLMFTMATHRREYFKEHLFDAGNTIPNTIVETKNGVVETRDATINGIKKITNTEKDTIKKWTISLLVVFIVAGFIIVLLASADSVFANLFSGIGQVFENIDLENLLARIILFVVTYIIFLGFIYAIKKGNTKEIKKQEVKQKDNFTIKMLLIVLNIVYLVFCYIQIKTLFAKIGLPGTFVYAEYARSGFFQLMLVSLINFALLIIASKRDQGKEKIISILNLLLIIFTAIIAVSSMYRMYMYAAEYGLTYLRVFVFAILITELAMLIPTIIYMFNPKFDLLKWCFIIGLSAYIALNFANLETMIISRNLSKDRSKVGIDYNYIAIIASCDNYDTVEKILQEKASDMDIYTRYELARMLYYTAADANDMQWQEFNISKYKVKEKHINTQPLEERMRTVENQIMEQETENDGEIIDTTNTLYH